MIKKETKASRSFVRNIGKMLKFYCIECGLEFDTEKELKEHKCKII